MNHRIDHATGAQPSFFGRNGYTVTALQAAWAAITSSCGYERDHPCEHLSEALFAAVHAGDDTDTVAAIAGALLGARWEASAVPARYRRLVHGWPGLDASDLVRLAVLTARGGRPDNTGWPPAGAHAYTGWWQRWLCRTRSTRAWCWARSTLPSTAVTPW